MSILRTICVICEEKFTSSDIIQGTYCGHIFHGNCLDNWILWKTSCPMCQFEFSSDTFKHRLFLELDDGTEILQKNENLKSFKTEVQITKKRAIRLQDQMREMKLNFRRLQEQFTTSEQSNVELKQEIHNLKQSMQELSVETKKHKSNNLGDLKNTEITQQNTSSTGLNDNNIVSTDSAMTRQIQILEQKVKHLSGELEKEIAINSRFYVEKFRHDCSINIEAENFLIIEDFPISEVTYPIKDTIIDLGTKLHLTVLPEDICTVRMLADDEYQRKSDMIALLVEFKSNYMKIKFLANTHFLNNYLTTTYNIRTIGDDVNSIYLYANEKLGNFSSFTELYIEGPYVNVRHKAGKRFMVNTIMGVNELHRRYIQEAAMNAAIVNSCN